MIVSIHHTEDPLARRLIADLYDSGFTVIEQGSADSDVELLLLTPSTVGQHQTEPSPENSVIPVLLVGCELPPALSGKEVDLAANYLSGYRHLLERLHEAALTRKRNPYRGLRPFSESHAPYFFGRQAFLNRLQQHITAGGKLIALVGASTSGKTSLIEAGLVSALRNAGNWLPVRIYIQDRPLHQLATRLQAMGEKRPALTSRLEADAGALSQVFNEFLPNDTRLLLVLDTFESAFARMSLSDRVHFLDALYRVIQNNTENVFVVIALRPESYERLLEYPEWAALLPSNRFLVPALSTGEISEIVEQPAGATGLSIEPGLTQHIVGDTARSNPKGLLLRLSFALSALWDSHQFSASRFESIGGISNAVNQHCESLFRNLSPMQQQIARHVLIWLAQISHDNEVNSRALPRNRFSFTWAEAGEVNNTLAILTGAQILNVYVDQTTGEEYIALTHEALLNEWKRYANWIEEEAENLPYASNLERLAADWAAHDYSGAFVLRGRELTKAALWVENPDHLYSPLLLDYITASKQTQQADEKQRQRQVRVQRGTLIVLVASWLLLAAVIAAGVSFASQLTEQRDRFTALQADSATQFAEAALQSSEIAEERDQFATRQVESANVASTFAAQYDSAATAQAVAESTLAPLRSTANALSNTLSDNATIQAELNIAATNQAQAEATTSALENQFRQYLANNLAQDATTLLDSDPLLALRLAAEAGTIAFSGESDDLKNSTREALTNTLQGYANRQIGEDVAQSWLIGNTHVVINRTEAGAAELWQLNPPAMIASLNNAVEQVIPISNGQLLVIDYISDTPDEIWQTELGEVVGQLSGEVASPQDEETDADIPNVVQLENGAYFLLRYEDELPSELWETAIAQRIATLEGDFEKIVPLADGYFFVRYTDRELSGGIWELSSSEMVQAADDVITEAYNNGIFVLRQSLQFDEIWRTNPFARVTQIVGRVTTVTDIQGHPYFIVQYAGGQPAQIWRSIPPIEIIHTFRGEIDVSITFLDRQYFLVRYGEESPSELWSADPLEMVGVLNGNVSNIQLDLVVDEQILVVDYLDNTVSEIWSAETGSLQASLSGNVETVSPILGDVYFVAQYEGNQPAEVWAAINPTLVGTLGEQQRRVNDIIPLKGGSFLVVLYEDEPGEIWQVDTDGVNLLSTLPDVMTQAVPIQGGDYLILDFLNEPAQIWQLTPFTPVITLESHIQDLSYDPANGRLTFVGDNNVVYGINLQIITALRSDGAPIPDNDLLTLICAYLAEDEPISTEQLAPFLAGMPPAACQEPTE